MEQTDQKNELQTLKNISAGKYRQSYLIYVRKSTDEPNNQKNSIAYQKSEGARFAARERLPIAPLTLPGLCLTGVISEKHSGFKENDDLTFTKDGRVQYQIDRPKFQRLVQYLSQGSFRGVVCLCWDRVSRNKGDDTIIRKLMRKGVDFRFVYANYDKTSAGALHMDIDGMFSEHHSRVTSEKVRLATESLRERGFVTCRAPIGYLNQGNTKHKPFDPERAPLIKKFFEFYATGGWTLSDLARFANRHGFTTAPMRRRRTQDEMLSEDAEDAIIEKVSRPVTVAHVHKILTNPFYTGRTPGKDGKYVSSASHERLVSDELFKEVQQALKGKRVSAHYTEKLYLPFRGLVRCTGCGRVYTPYLQKGIQYFGSRCAASCTNPKKSFNAPFLEEEVAKYIDRLTLTEKERNQLDSAASNDVSHFEEKRLARIEADCRRQKKIREDLAYLRANKLNLLKSGVYTPELLVVEEANLNAELITLQNGKLVSDPPMQAVVESTLKLSELLRNGSAYYRNAKSPEKEQIIRVVFSELNISGNTLEYKSKNGFQALQNRFLATGGQSTWLLEAVKIHSYVEESIQT